MGLENDKLKCCRIPALESSLSLQGHFGCCKVVLIMLSTNIANQCTGMAPKEVN